MGIAKTGESIFEGIVAGFNKNFPGGGGDRSAVDGNPALHMGAPNKGKTGPLGVVPKDGSLVGPKGYQPKFAPVNNAGSATAWELGFLKGWRVICHFDIPCQLYKEPARFYFYRGESYVQITKLL